MGMLDFLTGDSGTDPNAGIIMPMAAQAMRYDPRSALIAQMLQTGQQQLQQPTYSPIAAIAKALTGGIGGLSSMALTRQYMDASRSAPQEIGKALSGGSGNPVQELLSSQNPFARQMGYQMIPEYYKPTTTSVGQQVTVPATGQVLTQNTAPRTTIGQLQAERDAIAKSNPNDPRIAAYDAQIQKLNQEGGVEFTGNGAAPVPGYGGAKAGIAGQTTAATANAQNRSDLGFKPAIAAATAAATAPIETKKAINIAAGTAPIETFKTLFNPVVDRNTGEVSIPGLTNPQAVQAIMQAYGVTAQQLGGTRVAGIDASPPAATPLPGPPPAKPPVPTGTAPPPPSPQIVNPPAATASAPPSNGAPEQTKAPVPIGSMRPLDEIPSRPLPSPLLPSNAGTIIQGRNPSQMKANDEAVQGAQKQYDETQGQASAAVDVQSQLGTMKSLLDRGQLTTNLAGDIRQTLAGLIYAVGGSDAKAAQSAQNLLGINPSSADVFNKESTRLGFALARTMGAREAAQIVQGAIKANPNMLATVQGNETVIGLLRAAAQHDIDEQTYADAWHQKNGHYVGAKAWFDQNHPVQEYTSKVVPYELPRLANGGVNAQALLPNVTYNIQSAGHTGPAIWNGQGFIPVQQ